jgi:hypothetical protein
MTGEIGLDVPAPSPNLGEDKLPTISQENGLAGGVRSEEEIDQQHSDIDSVFAAQGLFGVVNNSGFNVLVENGYRNHRTMTLGPWSKFYLEGNEYRFGFPRKNEKYRIMVQVGRKRRFLYDDDWWIWAEDEDGGAPYHVAKIKVQNAGTDYWLRVNSHEGFDVISNREERFPFTG